MVDGGSRDATVQRARLRADRVISAPRGRASQMNAGAEKATGDVLLFLHADTRLPVRRRSRRAQRARNARAAPGAASTSRSTAGIRCCVVVGALMNLRSRLTGIATGDQAIFVKRDAFQAVGGFPAIELMEDIALSQAPQAGRPAALSARSASSPPARRWEEHGVISTMVLMWRLRLAYFFGADPTELARHYGHGR